MLDEIIPLNSQQYKILVQYKTFIRKLGREKVSKSLLTKDLQVIKELAKLIINGNETCEKTNVSSCKRMGEKKTTSTKKSSIKCRSGTITSDEESDEIWEQCYIEQKDQTEDETEYETEIVCENERQIEGEEEYEKDEMDNRLITQNVQSKSLFSLKIHN